jgi:hypothetical protein
MAPMAVGGTAGGGTAGRTVHACRLPALMHTQQVRVASVGRRIVRRERRSHSAGCASAQIIAASAAFMLSASDP